MNQRTVVWGCWLGFWVKGFRASLYPSGCQFFLICPKSHVLMVKNEFFNTWVIAKIHHCSNFTTKNRVFWHQGPARLLKLYVPFEALSTFEALCTSLGSFMFPTGSCMYSWLKMIIKFRANLLVVVRQISFSKQLIHKIFVKNKLYN